MGCSCSSSSSTNSQLATSSPDSSVPASSGPLAQLLADESTTQRLDPTGDNALCSSIVGKNKIHTIGKFSKICMRYNYIILGKNILTNVSFRMENGIDSKNFSQKSSQSCIY